jgi:hypothetical protein
MSDEFLPCPSCGPGTKVEEFIPLPDKYADFMGVICRECGMRGPRDTWNLRTPGPDVSRLLAAAKVALVALNAEFLGLASHSGKCGCAMCTTRYSLRAALAEYEAEERGGGI